VMIFVVGWKRFTAICVENTRSGDVHESIPRVMSVARIRQSMKKTLSHVLNAVLRCVIRVHLVKLLSVTNVLSYSAIPAWKVTHVNLKIRTRLRLNLLRKKA